MQYDGSIYINNENYESKKTYTVVSAPKKQDFDKFYSVLWQQEIDTVVVLGKLEEKGVSKIDAWWESGSSQGFKVTKVVEEVAKDTSWELIQFNMENKRYTGKTRTPKILWYKNWPDHGVPDSTDFIAFHEKYLTLNPLQVLVHCSAGVGRTGTFITYDRVKDNRYQTATVGLVQQTINELRVQRDHMVQKEIQYKFLLDLLKLPAKGYAEDYKNLFHPEKLPIPLNLHGTRYLDIHSQPPYLQLPLAGSSHYTPRVSARIPYSTIGENTQPAPVASQFAPPILASHLAPPITASRGTQKTLLSRSIGDIVTNQFNSPITAAKGTHSTPVTRQSVHNNQNQLWKSIGDNKRKTDLRARLKDLLCCPEFNPNKHKLSEIRLVWLTNWIYSDDPNELGRRESFVQKKWMKDKHFKPFVVLDGIKPQSDNNLCLYNELFVWTNESDAVGDSDYLYRLSGNEAGSLTFFKKKGNERYRVGYAQLDEEVRKLKANKMTTTFYSTAM